MKSQLREMLTGVQIGKIIAGILCALAAGALFRKLTEFGVFMTLLLSAILFFGVYGLVLLALKESFVISVTEPGLRLLKKRKQKQ